MSGSRLKQTVSKGRGDNIGAVVLFAILAVIPFINSGYITYILPQYMLFGIMAMSLSLTWGYAGIVSFGQAAFFAMGGYAMGICMGKTGLPINPAYAGLLIGMLVCTVLAGLAAFVLFSAGVRATYFVIVTLAFSIMTEQILVSQSGITGGWSGMFIDRISLTGIGDYVWQLGADGPMYYFILAMTILAYMAMALLCHNKFGKVLIGIRENEDRMLALGYRTGIYKSLAFAISACISGFAGALYATHAGFISPSLAGVLFSTEVVVWVAIGGRQSLIGALAAGIAVSSLSNYLSSVTPEYWSLILGILFMGCIIYFQGGIAGALGKMRRSWGSPS